MSVDLYQKQMETIPYKPVKWLACERQTYRELFEEPFPGRDKITEKQQEQFRAKPIARYWKRIYKTIKNTNPKCLICLAYALITLN